MTTDADYSPRRDPFAKLQRRWVQYRVAEPLRGGFDRPTVSFTFDDFPRTAASNGASLLDKAGLKGTYYVATRLLGQTTPMGEIADISDIQALHQAGHHIAAHSHAHEDLAGKTLTLAKADIDAGCARLADMLGTSPAEHFAYPFGETTLPLKHRLKHRFQTARGVLAGINRRGNDLMQLRSAELTPEPWTHDRAGRLLDQLEKRPGWLIFFTHDVSDTPSPFGITPKYLGDLIDQVRQRGFRIASIEDVTAMEGLAR